MKKWNLPSLILLISAVLVYLYLELYHADVFVRWRFTLSLQCHHSPLGSVWYIVNHGPPPRLQQNLPLSHPCESHRRWLRSTDLRQCSSECTYVWSWQQCRLDPGDRHYSHFSHINSCGLIDPTGPCGPTGPAGLCGPNGPTGLCESTGTAGPCGPTDPTGPYGPTGQTGSCAPTGPCSEDMAEYWIAWASVSSTGNHVVRQCLHIHGNASMITHSCFAEEVMLRYEMDDVFSHSHTTFWQYSLSFYCIYSMDT